MIFQFECCYCGYKYTRELFSRASIEAEKCSRCNDTTMKYKEYAEDSKVDYYKGCPPFPDDEND